MFLKKNTINISEIVTFEETGYCENVFNKIKESVPKIITASNQHLFTEPSPFDIRRYLKKKFL